MLGGGVFVTQNKILPGAYITFVSASRVTNALGERGIVAMAYPLNKNAGSVIEITSEEFYQDAQTKLGIDKNSIEARPFREIFTHAKKCIIYDLGLIKTATDALSALEAYDFNILAVYDATANASTYITKVEDWRNNGKKCQAVVYNVNSPNNEGIINVVSTVSDYDASEFKGDGIETDFIIKLKPSSISEVYVNDTAVDAGDYTYTASSGTLTFDTAPANNAKIEVRYSTPYALIAWVAGLEAGCKINESCTNVVYDGEFNIITDKNQSQLETCITSGQFVFHLSYGEICTLEDINSLTTTSAEKGDDFKSNQTIRVIDQIANDIAKLFNIKYLGKIPNDASGRVSLWGDIVAHHRQLETLRAIENFDATLVTVEQGISKKAVVVNDVITPINAMAQLYMTVVIQ